LVDVAHFYILPPPDHIQACLIHLKRYFHKIVIFEPDPWVGYYDNALRAASEHIDYIWGFTTDWDLINEPCYKGKSILFPNVGGFEHFYPDYQHDLNWDRCTFNFTGSIQGYNLNRAYWILEAVRLKLPITIHITDPAVDDGLNCASSLLLYMQKLAATHASLNLATRQDGSRILTGRAVEVISLNRLLIQEYCPALRNYYIEGEHFLDFYEIKDLKTTLEFLKAHPKSAQKICHQGHQFYLERYSCKKMVQHIQTFL
jgi:hypothetical protein